MAAEAAIEHPKTWVKPTFAAPIPVVRCQYLFPESHDRAGEQCKKWSLRGTTVCFRHGGQLPNVQAHAAATVEHYRLRLVDAGDMAIDRVVWLAENAGSEAVSLKASTEILDRIGVRGGSELEVTVDNREDAAQAVRDRLATIRRRTLEGDPADLTDATPATSSDSVTEPTEPTATAASEEPAP
jgi:hypothetical protein